MTLDEINAKYGKPINVSNQSTSFESMWGDNPSNNDNFDIEVQKNILRSKGEPVSTQPDRVEPTTLGSIARGLLKPLARIAESIRKPAGAALNINNPEKLSEKFDPSKPTKTDYLGDVYPLGYGVDKNGVPFGGDMSGRDAVKAAGDAANLASYVIGGGSTKAIVPLAEQTFKEGVKQGLKSAIPLAVEQGTAGLLGSSGQAITQGDTLKEAAPNIATTTIGSAVLAPVMSTLGSKAGSLTRFIQTPAETLKKKAMEQGIDYMSSKIGSVDNAFRDTTYDYVRTIGGKEVRQTITPIDTFAKYKLVPEVTDGTINVSKIYDTIGTNISRIDDEIDTTLKSTGKKVSIDDLGVLIENQIKGNDNLKRGGKVTDTINSVKSKLEDWRQSYGDEIDINEINQIRKTSNTNFKKDRFDIDRIVGDTTRDIVYNSTDDKIVQSLLNDQRALINAEKFADRLKGKAVKGGRLGNYVWSGLGATIGKASSNNDFIGTVLGAFGGRKLSEFMQSRTFRSLPADVKGYIEKNYMKSPQSSDTKITASIISDINNIITNVKNKTTK